MTSTVSSKAADRTGPTWEVFSERFDRCFRRVSLYVGRRVSDRETLERIVRRVLVENRELLVIAPCDQLEELKCLKASADRLLALDARLEVAAEHLDETGDRTPARSPR